MMAPVQVLADLAPASLPALARPQASPFEQIVLAATDGSAEALPALRVAGILERTRGARVHVLTVLDPVPMVTPGPGMGNGGVVDAELVRTASAARLALVREQAVESGDGARWPVELRVGAPAMHIDDEARILEAGLIVTGLRHHTRLDRFFRGERLLQLMRQTEVPVLAVLPSLTTLPSRITVAVDFSRSSLRAAHVAARLLADGGTMCLVYVQPRAVESTEDTEGLDVIYSQGVVGAFERLCGALALPPRAEVHTVLLEGSPAAELSAFAERSSAELIAIGSHRHGLIDRWMIGSVTTDLLREARCSMLVTPPAE